MLYTFHRKDGWYPLELPDVIETANGGKTSDQVALDCVACNPGTLKVINKSTGKVLFDAGQQEAHAE